MLTILCKCKGKRCNWENSAMLLCCLPPTVIARITVCHAASSQACCCKHHLFFYQCSKTDHGQFSCNGVLIMENTYFASPYHTTSTSQTVKIGREMSTDAAGEGSLCQDLKTPRFAKLKSSETHSNPRGACGNGLTPPTLKRLIYIIFFTTTDLSWRILTLLMQLFILEYWLTLITMF